MPDNDDSTNTPEIRKKLEDALAQLKERDQQISDRDSQLAALNAKILMPNLNDRQRKVVMRELTDDKLDLTEENVKAVADDLGYNMNPPTPNAPTTPSDPNTPSSNGQPDPNADPDNYEEIMVSLATMSAIDQANHNAVAGRVHPDLETEIRNTKSPEELRHLIRTKGPRSGLLHEWDDQ